jgi:hypothetical protein
MALLFSFPFEIQLQYFVIGSLELKVCIKGCNLDFLNDRSELAPNIVSSAWSCGLYAFGLGYPYG